jgi:subtilase family serine protease
MKVAILAALLVTLGVAPTLRPTLTTHVPAAVAHGSVAVAGAPARTQVMELAISLPLRNEAQLRAQIRALYDPTNPAYRRFLDVEEFTELYGPEEADYRALLQFAGAYNLHAHALAANRRVLDVEGTVADVERAFHVTIRLYREPGDGRIFYAPDREPTLDLAVPVLHVSGLDNAVVPSARLVRGNDFDAAGHLQTGSGPRGNFIGSDVRAAYYGGSALTGTGQSVGLFEYAGYNLADVANYFRQVRQRQRVPIIGVSVNGASLTCIAPKCDDAEQVLDIEEAISMAPGLRSAVVYVGTNDVSILNAMASDDGSKQLSCSWGWRPDAIVIDPIFEEFAAQGQSFLVATGDDGYHLKAGAVWPADDELVTAVGGTDLTTAGPAGPWQSEVGWSYSGGGPSPDGIAIPAYQTPFINAQNDGSKTLRNVPDIAGDADTDNYSCYDLGCSTGNGGTSYAAPLWAGYIALANELAAALDKPPVGFLNPTLYTLGARSNYAALFHDQNNGKYSAVPGFDLVTGFGTPDGDVLLRALVLGR